MKKSLILSYAIISAATLNAKESNVISNDHDSSSYAADFGRVDARAPIGVMRDHAHQKGGWMASYRYMFMQMDSLYQGNDTINNSASGYMLSPTEMDMQMHMVGIMYSPTDRITLMGMFNYVESSMNMVDSMGVNSSMETSGLADTTVGAIYQFYKEPNKNAHFGLNLIIPTGDTDKELANGTGLLQPYPMQLGAGSYGISPSVTLNHYVTDTFSWGAQASYTTYLEDNDQDYTLGDRYEMTSWLAQQLTPHFSLSGRVKVNVWEQVSGAQTGGIFNMNPVMSSPADPDNTGGVTAEALIGVNYLSKNGIRIGVEAGKTFYQDYYGVQLGSDWNSTIGVSFSW